MDTILDILCPWVYGEFWNRTGKELENRHVPLENQVEEMLLQKVLEDFGIVSCFFIFFFFFYIRPCQKSSCDSYEITIAPVVEKSSNNDRATVSESPVRAT